MAKRRRRRWRHRSNAPPLGVLPALAAALLLLLLVVTAPVDAAGAAGVQRHLERMNKPGVRSIESADGDIIDCVPRHKQRALDHPLLANHTVQTPPSHMPASLLVRQQSTKSATARAWQTWHHAGHCPRGTVAVRRTTAADVLRARSLALFGRKDAKQQRTRRRRPMPPDVVTGNGHEHAIAYTSSPEGVYGARATISVWSPAIEEANGFSLSQLWILSGSFNGSDLNSIEAGWQSFMVYCIPVLRVDQAVFFSGRQVSPELYGDSRPRLFTYWTSDAYEATGCYNALCPGFVQTSSRIAIGASISPVSSVGGPQYDMTLLVWKDPKLGNWWLSYGEGAGGLVGYWPAELFTHLSDHANMVEWGGEVVNTHPDGAHTATQMGSGHFASEGFGRAAYFRNLEIVDADNSLSAVPLDAIQTLAEDAGCYDIRKAYDGGWGAHFYYGGPGHNSASCP
uniref:Neprosin PEP catalytic domain-containing protein n=1 Tax=Leersia perrieri TaxID=77586 RepID=A0A0D9XB14_9ORYZ